MQHCVRRCNQVGLLTAGGGEGATVGQSCTMPVESIRLRAVSPVGVGSRQCRLFRDNNETNKHCVPIAAQSAGIKAIHYCSSA